MSTEQEKKLFSRAQCIACAILSSVFSSVATLFKVQGVNTVPPLLAATVGILFAGLLSWIFLIIRRQIPKLSTVKSVAFPFIMLILCRPIIANLLFTIGLSMSSGIKAIFLTKMEPYLVIFWVWILDGKRPAPAHLLLLVIHVIGAILLSVGDLSIGKNLELGDPILFFAVVSAGLSYRYAPLVTKALTPIQTATLSETIGGLLTLPLALAFCPLSFGPEQQIGWCYVFVHSIMFYAIAVPLLYSSMHGIESWLASTLRAIGPIVAVPIAWIFFGERLVPIQMLGAAIVLLTSAAISKAEKRGREAAK